MDIAGILKPYILEIIGVLALGLIAVLRNNFLLKTKYDDLTLRIKTLDVDDTERTKKISASAQELILKTYSAQADDIRHQRDLIDKLNTDVADLPAIREERDRLAAQVATLQTEVNSLKTQVNTNRDEISKITTERDTYKADSILMRQLLAASGIPVPPISTAISIAKG